MTCGTFLASLFGQLACEGCAGGSAEKSEHQFVEDAWLTQIGTGPAQTAKVCGRGNADRIAKALCTQPAPAIQGMSDLYRALRLDDPQDRHVAATTHSLALSARLVSSANPRTFVFENATLPGKSFSYHHYSAAAFTRGEQFVELAGLDPETYEYNFYLLRFEQACNRTRCTPEDLLTERIERGWSGWTLYSDHDLQDTPLDCLSCHLPFGKGTHKQLLMRQVYDPWMHWGEFRGGDERFLCREYPEDGGEVVVTAEGLDLLRNLEGPKGRYAGIPIEELHASKSGAVFASFVADAEQAVRLSPYRDDYPYEQVAFQTREVLCERFKTGTSPTWDRHRRESFSKGLPVPFYGPDVLDPKRRAELLTNRMAFLRRNGDQSAFDVAASLISDEAAAAVGFVPEPEATAPDILTAMCVRCHSNDTDPGLRRSGFNAQAIESIRPETFREIARRLRLPLASPDLMPPRRVGELPPWAITRIEDYLRQRCAVPDGCD